MEGISESLINNGAFGLTTLIFLYLFVQERRDNKELHAARLADIKQLQDKYAEPIDLMGRTVKLIYDNIEKPKAR